MALAIKIGLGYNPGQLGPGSTLGPMLCFLSYGHCDSLNCSHSLKSKEHGFRSRRKKNYPFAKVSR